MSSPIFVLSAGRSGSTLVQRLLNSYPDVLISGEHRGFLKDVANGYFRLIEGRQGATEVFSATGIGGPEQLQQLKDPTQWQAWMNFFNAGDVRETYRQFVRRFFRHPHQADGESWGFKEIRYGGDDRVIEFLSQLFPDAIFVFLSRHGFDTLSSQLSAFEQGRRLIRNVPSPAQLRRCRTWSRQYADLLNWHQSGKIRSYWLEFEEFTKNEAAFEPLLTALGKQFGPDQRAVLALEDGRGSAFQNQSRDFQRWKALSYPTLIASEWMMGGVNDRLGYDPPPSIRWFTALRRMFQPGNGAALRQ